VETVAMPWDLGSDGPEERARRLTLPELAMAIDHAGFEAVECVYRFRDRVILRARR
jgi:hypothetical protein